MLAKIYILLMKCKTKNRTMFGRENLIWEWSDDLDAGFKVYDVAKANEVMDKLEARIKELETENEKLKSETYKGTGKGKSCS